ncbi:MAG: HD domain-containing protein [Candidatus Helarchaeota archaeon]
MKFEDKYLFDSNYLLKYFEDNTIIQDIIHTKVFQRLKKISLLGFLPKTFNSNKNFSRFDHSLGVAYLADFIAEKFNFDDKERLFFVVSSLLHDIGHLPFSHVTEKVMIYTSNKSHHFYSTYIVKSKKNLQNIIEKGSDYNLRNEVLYLLKKKKGFSNRLALNFLKNPINIDTLDAICRTAIILNKNYINPIELINLLKLKNEKIVTDKSSLSYFRNFWNLKSDIYKNYIYNPRNLFHEALLFEIIYNMFQNKDYFRKNMRKMTDEKLWRFLLNNSESKSLLDLISKREKACFWYCLKVKPLKDVHYTDLNHLKRKIARYFNISSSDFIIYFDKIKKFEFQHLISYFNENHNTIYYNHFNFIFKRSNSEKIIYFFFLDENKKIPSSEINSFFKKLRFNTISDNKLIQKMISLDKFFYYHKPILVNE